MKKNKIQIYINGKKKLVSTDLKLISIINDLSLNNAFIAVEVNKEIIPKSEYKNRKIDEYDKIEILEMIGGG